MSQVDQIARILEEEGHIDNFRCVHERISLRLAARIDDLRRRGWGIETQEQPDKNTVYVLRSKGQEKKTRVKPVDVPVPQRPKFKYREVTLPDGSRVMREVLVTS